MCGYLATCNAAGKSHATTCFLGWQWSLRGLKRDTASGTVPPATTQLLGNAHGGILHEPAVLLDTSRSTQASQRRPSELETPYDQAIVTL